MAAFSHPEFDDHEQVVFGRDAASNLRTIIAIHNTNRGPALGGCRIWPYADDQAALKDVLRLSRGMTYKAAVAGLPLGGGKSIIIADSKTGKTDAMMQAFGRQIDHLGGRYITAEDVGSSVKDMDIVRTMTPHVVGLSTGVGDPSPSTAHGVFIGIQAAVRHQLKRDDLKGLTVAVQGVGHVGYYLCRYLADAGAQLVVTDINQDALDKTIAEFGAKTVAPDDIYAVDAQIFAPCALGAVINDRTIPQLKASIVAGSSNNQLADDSHGVILKKAGILYAPDYVINAGGLIDVARSAVGFDIDTARQKLFQIDDTLAEIFVRADRDGLPTSDVADQIAEERFGKKSSA